jgi:hypothetical protein
MDGLSGMMDGWMGRMGRQIKMNISGCVCACGFLPQWLAYLSRPCIAIEEGQIFVSYRISDLELHG